MTNIYSNQKIMFQVFKIWDQAEHNAFTDIINSKESIIAHFARRRHVPGPVELMARSDIVSKDGEKWKSAALLEKYDFDLRDSKLSIDHRQINVLMAVQTIIMKPRINMQADDVSILR